MSLRLEKFARVEPGQTVKLRILPQDSIPHVAFMTEAARKYPLGSPQFRDAVEKDAERLWTQEVGSRHGLVESAEEKDLTARHTGHSEDEVDVSRCLACVLAKRVSEGRPPAQKLWVTVLRDAEPLELVPFPITPKQHKKRRWMSESYHRRIQKKWTKRAAGQIELRPKQERVVISMSMAIAKAIRDRFFKTPILGDDFDDLEYKRSFHEL